MKLIRSSMAVIFALGLSASFAHAQSGVDIFAGAGTMTDSSSGTTINTFGTGNFTTPKLGGTFGKVGADAMLNSYFGIGGEVDFRLAQGAYAGLNFRPTFYDFNAIWAPTGRSLKRVVPEIQAGIGGANLRFYAPQSSCDVLAGCSNSNVFLESSNHFQTHLSAGIRFYATPHLYFKPQIEARYINNFFQFGSNWVPEYSASVGWSFGER